MIIFMPIFGSLSDKVGRRSRVWMWQRGSRYFGLPGVLAHAFRGLAAVLTVAVCLGIFYASVLGTEASLFDEAIRSRNPVFRDITVYQFSGIFASGLIPLIASTLILYNGGQPWLLCGYIALVSLVSSYRPTLCAMALPKLTRAFRSNARFKAKWHHSRPPPLGDFPNASQS